MSTRKVDDLVKALGADSGISKSEVSRICADLDEEVAAFRDRSLRGEGQPECGVPGCRGRHRVRADGWRQVLGFAVGDSADRTGSPGSWLPPTCGRVR